MRDTSRKTKLFLTPSAEAAHGNAESGPRRNNYGARIPANKSPQAEEPFDDFPVHKAAEQGDISKLISFVHSAENIDDYDTYYECTPLHLAIQADHAEAVKILLEAGADPEKLDYSDTALDPPHPALDLAAWRGSYKSLRVLIDHGTAMSSSSLVLAASCNMTDCMTIIVQELNKDDSLYSTRQACARTALIHAARCWHTEAVELLLKHVAGFPDSSAIEDRYSLTEALFMALDDYCCDRHCRERIYQRSPDKYKNLSQRFLSMAHSLAHYGADINVTMPGTDMTRFWLLTSLVPSFNLESILDFLLSRGLRVDEGPRINDDTGQYHSSPFMVALAYIKDVRTIKTMVEAGAGFKFTDQNLNTPLHLAQTREIAEFLCSLGADASAKDNQGRMPLHTACHEVRADVVDFLISRGSSVNELATANQWTALHFATCGRYCMTSHIYIPEHSWNAAKSTARLQTAQILLENGAKIQATASDGLIALHGAAHKGDIDLIRFLLEHDADVNAATLAGETALHIVMAIRAIQSPTEAQILAMATLLLDYGANLEAKDKTGATPLRKAMDLMVSRNRKISPTSNPGRFNILIEKGADRYTVDNAGVRVENLVDLDHWFFDEMGRLKSRSHNS